MSAIGKTVAKWMGFKTPKVQKPQAQSMGYVDPEKEAEEIKRKRAEKFANRGGPLGTDYTGQNWRNQILGGPDVQGGFK